LANIVLYSARPDMHRFRRLAYRQALAAQFIGDTIREIGKIQRLTLCLDGLAEV
jgi:hypothetical protein